MDVIRIFKSYGNFHWTLMGKGFSCICKNTVGRKTLRGCIKNIERVTGGKVIERRSVTFGNITYYLAKLDRSH